VLADLCYSRGVHLFRGSEDDVLDRYYQAANTFGLDIIVRITSDCPLIDPVLVDEMVQFYLVHMDEYDLVTNRHPLTYPDGLDADVMSAGRLEHVWAHATEQHQREHTIPYFWDAGMRIYNYEHPDRLFEKHRWTLDYPEDYELIRQIFEALYKDGELFCTQDILNYLGRRPDLPKINAMFIQS